jgi:enediyne biosynthesis protein E4
MILEAKSNPANHWVSFELEGSPANRLALNARVRITTGKLQQMGEIRSGGSYLSQNDLRLHFGLGDAARIDQVEVLWPNGKSQVLRDVAADCFYHLKQDGVLTVTHVPK